MPTNGEAPAAETAAPAGPASLGWGWGSCPALYVSYGLSALKGRQPELTGALAAVPSFTALSPPMGLDYFGVFDGHSGAAVANYLTEQLHGAIADQILRELVAEAPRFLHGPQGDVEGWWRTAMADAFQTVDAELLKGAGGVDASVAGATALVALVLEEYVVLANCGVSRAVISRGGEILQLTSEHRSNRPDEKQRVENGGGRVDESTNTVDEFLPTSRAFGMELYVQAIRDRRTRGDSGGSRSAGRVPDPGHRRALGQRLAGGGVPRGGAEAAQQVAERHSVGGGARQQQGLGNHARQGAGPARGPRGQHGQRQRYRRPLQGRSRCHGLPCSGVGQRARPAPAAWVSLVWLSVMSVQVVSSRRNYSSSKNICLSSPFKISQNWIQ
ncbi:hypothetical protein VPH35_050958 [Triticum aestivum]